MKKLLKIAGVDALQSFFPVLLWALLPVFTDNSLWAEGYIVTYPYQFIGDILLDVLFKSQIKLDMDEYGKPGDRTKTGLILYGISWLLLILLSFAGWRYVQMLFGFGQEHWEIFQMSLLSLGLSYMLYAIIMKKQYERKNGAMLTVLWWMIEILSCFLLSVTGNPIIWCIIPMAVFCLGILIPEIKDVQFRFCMNGMRFISVHLVSGIGMFTVYLFGLRNLCSDPAMLASYNMMSMCSDTQWDIIESAIDKHTTIGVCEGTWKEKKALLEGLLFGFVLFGTAVSCVLACSLLPVYRDSLDFKLVWTLVFVECTWFILSAVANVMEMWMAFEKPSRIQPFLMSFIYVIRISVTISCPSIWAVSIAMACAEGFYILSTAGLYLVKRRRHTESVPQKRLL